jgi:glycine cleavage system H protein
MSDFLEIKVDKFTFRVSVDRCYNSEGIWTLAMGNTVRIGLSDYVQQHNGDIAFAEVKPEGTVLKVGDEAAAIETIKVNIMFSSPITGRIVRVNPLMETTPEIINQDPYEEGWLCEIEAKDWETDRKNLLDAAAYFDLIKSDAESEVKKDE